MDEFDEYEYEDDNEVRTISFTFAYNDPDGNETTISKVLDLSPDDKDGLQALTSNFFKFIDLAGFDYKKYYK